MAEDRKGDDRPSDRTARIHPKYFTKLPGNSGAHKITDVDVVNDPIIQEYARIIISGLSRINNQRQPPDYNYWGVVQDDYQRLYDASQRHAQAYSPPLPDPQIFSDIMFKIHIAAEAIHDRNVKTDSSGAPL